MQMDCMVTGSAPSASTVNVPYFVSNEYLIFDPNIYYKTGEPAQSAYNSGKCCKVFS